MRRSARIISAFASACVFASLLAGAPAPALAASPKIYVDDPGDGTQCSQQPSYSTIQAAVDAAPITGAVITICSPASGMVLAYEETVTIAGYSKLKLVGKGFVTLIPPSSPFSGALIAIMNSTDVTISGLNVNGYESFDSSGAMFGIHVLNSSATITNNRVMKIRRSPLSNDLEGHAIYVESTGAPYKVLISQNTITEYQSAGIWVIGNVTPTITGNRLDASGAACNYPVGMALFSITGGAISKNTITHDWNASNHHCSAGIILTNASNVKVTSNKIYNVKDGIKLIATTGTSTHNTISKNILDGTDKGIHLQADGSVDTASVSGNTVTSNTLINRPMGDSFGILLDLLGGPNTETVSGNTVKSNTLQGYLHDAVTDNTPGPNVTTPNKIGFLKPGG